MTLSDGSLWPATDPVPNSLTNKFNPFVFAYTVKVPVGTTRIGVTPILLASKARRVTVNGAVITIVVTTPDGVTTETYRLTVATE